MGLDLGNRTWYLEGIWEMGLVCVDGKMLRVEDVFWGVVVMEDGFIERPCRPDLRCGEHEGLCDLLHSIYGRLLILEQRVEILERRIDGEVTEQ